MFLHSLFFPQYLPLSDFSPLNHFMFNEKDLVISEESKPLIEEPKPLIEEEPREEILINEPKEEILTEKPKEEILVEEPKPQQKQKTTFQVKNVQDDLFWLIFVAIYGETEYYRNKYNYGKVEIQEKQKIAEKMTDAEFNKKMKWKWTKIQRIEMISDLTNTPRMPIAILNALSAYYECMFILVDSQKKVYIEYGTECETKYLIFINTKMGAKTHGHASPKKEYLLEMDPSIFEKIREEYFQLEHYERPLKAISNYKKIELDTISKKLGLEESEKASKQEVYDRLRLYLSDSAIL